MSGRPSKRRATSPLIVSLSGFVLLGLAIAQFATSGQIDKYLIGALLMLALGGAAGPLADTLLRAYVESKVQPPEDS